jgi:hypothetical protein
MEQAIGFDRKMCKALGDKAQAILQEAFKDSEFNVARGSGSFDFSEYNLKVKFTLADGESKAHRQYRELSPFPPKMLDATFPYGSLGEITVTGWLPNRPKFDIQVRDSNGKERSAPSKNVLQSYARKFGDEGSLDKTGISFGDVPDGEI